MTGVAKHTIPKLFADLGAACAKYQEVTMRDLPCRRIQVDEGVFPLHSLVKVG
jgi:hypothetical protein